MLTSDFKVGYINKTFQMESSKTLMRNYTFNFSFSFSFYFFSNAAKVDDLHFRR